MFQFRKPKLTRKIFNELLKSHHSMWHIESDSSSDEQQYDVEDEFEPDVTIAFTQLTRNQVQLRAWIGHTCASNYATLGPDVKKDVDEINKIINELRAEQRETKHQSRRAFVINRILSTAAQTSYAFINSNKVRSFSRSRYSNGNIKHDDQTLIEADTIEYLNGSRLDIEYVYNDHDVDQLLSVIVKTNDDNATVQERRYAYDAAPKELVHDIKIMSKTK